MTVFIAATPQATRVTDLVGLNLQNATASALGATEVSFQEVFLSGQLAAGQGVTATIGGVAQQAQVDAKTFNADGSVRSAVITLRQPALAAGASVGVMLSAGTLLAGTGTGAAVDLATALSRHSLAVDLAIANTDGTTAPVHVDVVAAMQAALAAGTASFWQRGAQETQARVDVAVSGSLHLVVDLTAGADGSLTADVAFRNDLAMGATGGAVTYAATVTLDGAVTTATTGLTQYQYQDWDRTVSTDAATGVANVQHDIAALEQTGAIARFDLGDGTSAATVATEASAVATPGWDAPLAADGVTEYMPSTGARPDIGPTTQANAVWLLTQDASAARYALGQADAAGAVPWHMWNAAAGTWLDTAAYADIWTDPRGGAATYTTGLTQQNNAASGWTPDTSHEPDLSYDAYLLTGDRTYLDDLNAEAAWGIDNLWPAGQARNYGFGNLIATEQLRSAAWTLREVDEAAYANPAGSAEKAYFTQIADNNWSWVVGQIPTWTAEEGQTYGYIPGSVYGAAGILPPWQQDYFVSTAVEAAEQGNADALTYLEWSVNFIAGRFLNAAQGFNPHNGISYWIGNTDSTGAYVTSWAALQASTVSGGMDNGTGWASSDGDYAELALQALAGIINVTSSTQAIAAYAWLSTSGAPFSTQAALLNDAQFDISPKGAAATAAPPIVATPAQPPTKIVSGSADELALFDSHYYLARNPDVARAGIDPFWHYISNGALEGRSPSAMFDVDYYLSHNPDVVGTDPLFQYATKGWKLGANPDAFFDSSYYLLHNPDVAAAGINPLLHYSTFGWKEGRNPSLAFDTDAYLVRNPDVAAAGFDPLAHYLEYGMSEGRPVTAAGYLPATGPDPMVDVAYYDRQLGATVIPTGDGAAAAAAGDYAASGWLKGLDPNAFFDTSYYLDHNPDVAAAHIDPLTHYENFGWTEGRDPSAIFSTGKYLAANPDVSRAGVDPLLHYMEFGRSEGRAIYAS